MSWNLLNGGVDGQGERQRAAIQREVITETGPDVLLIQEARGFDHDGGRRLYEAERAWGLRGHVGLAPGTGQHTAVFVSDRVRPMSFVVDSTHFHHSASTLTLEHARFDAPISFTSVHLCPSSPAPRRAEAAQLAGLAAPGQLSIVAGDCNSPAPEDPPVDLDQLPPHFQPRYHDGAGDADRGAIGVLLSAGLIDIGARAGDLTPTVPAGGFPDAEFVPFRSDFFLASPPLADRATGYRVLVDERTSAASDHYPVLVDLVLP